MALLFSTEEDTIYTNTGVGHLLLSALICFDIQIDNFGVTMVWRDIAELQLLQKLLAMCYG